MLNVMVALPNIGGALFSTPQSLADACYYMPCSNAAKTRNQLKFGGMLQTNETILAASGPKFTTLWGHLEDILLLNKLFFRLSIRAQIAIFGDFFASCVFSEPSAAHFRPAF